MSYHAIFAGVVAVTAIAMLLNEQVLKLPKTIALTIISVTLSFIITLSVRLTPSIIHPLHNLLSSVDFKTTVLDVMLGYLLFASSLHINTIALKKHFSIIIYLASIGVITSTIFTGFILWRVSQWVHLPITLADCLIFGALISPTDPVAVAAVFKTTKNVPERIKTKITGESLFNDAAGILLLVVLVQIFYLGDTKHMNFTDISMMAIRESVGGIIWGILVGYITSIFLIKTNDSEVSILITVAAASCGYSAAGIFHVSGAITMVIAGLIVGNSSKAKRFSETTTLSVSKFWDLVDGMLNSFLFVLIGLEMLTIVDINYSVLVMGIIGIIIVAVARFGSMLLPSIILIDRKKREAFKWSEITLLCWGGVRGAISLALALSIPELPDSLVAITYFVVIFSILIQGSSFKWVVKKLYPQE
ncbi:MAG: monovalent cation:H+ antiporter, family [Pseudomonadota bacterium]|nr:monovalent cation:H+ antiporter, family [Pseudomonadota bacterium]